MVGWTTEGDPESSPGATLKARFPVIVFNPFGFMAWSANTVVGGPVSRVVLVKVLKWPVPFPSPGAQ